MTCFVLKTGQTMSSFCKEHNLNYDYAQKYCDRLGKTPEQAISVCKYRKEHNITKEKYFIDGKTLPVWCREHKINYSSVFSRAGSRNITPVQAALDMYRERN